MLRKLTAVFTVGGIIYSLMETTFRGKTHISMFFAGGFSALLTQLFCNMLKPFCKLKLPVKCIISAVIITLVELVTGLIVNIKLKKKVWDYSKKPHNFKGQICLSFSALWLLLSLPLILLCRLVAGKE